MRDPLRHHRQHRSDSGHVIGDSFMERLSERVASGMGTVGFLVVSSTVILAWVLSNHVAHFLLESWKGLLDGKGFDPAPFILLNLVFSAVAFYTGALVIIAQKAAAKKATALEEAEAKHREEIAAEHSKVLHELRELLDLAKPGGLTALQEHLDQRLDKLAKPAAPKRRTAK